jgi:hypothetical protein
MTAGYSSRNLVQKLGIKEGTRVIVIGAPPNYQSLLKPLPSGASIHTRLPASSDFIHAFARSHAELARKFPRLAGSLTDDGILWISWPKRSGGMPTDLDENVVRELGLTEGLVDVKVCAVDETWSGLKFVRRLVNRAPRSK